MNIIHKIRLGILLLVTVTVLGTGAHLYAPMYVQADATVRKSANGAWSYIVLDETNKQIQITALDDSMVMGLLGGAPEAGKVTIPSTIDGYQVLKIGDINADSSVKGVFENLAGVKDANTGEEYSIKQLVIPEGVTVLGTNCFKNVKCEEIIIPSGVTTIGESCFQDSKIEKVTLPDSVASIGELAFGRCNSLSEINYGTGLKEIGSKAFIWCTSLTDINIPDSVTTLGEGAFAECTSATTLTVGNGITELPKTAFFECTSLKSASLPAGLTGIGESAFQGCSSLTQIVLPESVTALGNKAFEGCNSLTQIALPTGVTTIGKNTFKGCSSLSEITLPISIQSIGENAFLTNYKSVKDSSNGESSVWHDEVITDAKELVIVIPKELSDISSLELTVYVNVTFKVYKDNSTVIQYFNDNSVTNYITYNIPQSSTDEGNEDKNDNSGAGDNNNSGITGSNTDTAVKEVTGEDKSVEGASEKGTGDADDKSTESTESTEASKEASGNAADKKIVYKIGSTYTAGNYKYKLLSASTASFAGCKSKNLTKVNIPATIKFDKKTYKITEVAGSAFKNNKKLKTITIGKNVKKIGSKTFMNCKKLRKMVIKTKNLKSIGKSAFKGVKFGSKGVDITVPKGKKKKYTKLIIKARK